MLNKKIVAALLVSILWFPQVGNTEIRKNDPIYWSNEDWAVYSYPSEAMCEMSTKGPGGEFLTYAVFPNFNTRLLQFAIPRANKNLNDSKIRVVIGPKMKIWGDEDFEVTNRDKYIEIKSPNMPVGIEDDFAQGTLLAVFDFSNSENPAIIFGVSLRGADEAVTNLRKCISQIK